MSAFPASAPLAATGVGCRPGLPLERLAALLHAPAPLTTLQQVEVMALAQACYESWCLRPGCRQRIELRLAGLVLLARACLRAGRHGQGLIHARRAWRLLRRHPRRDTATAEVLGLLVDLAEDYAPAEAEHWRHLRAVLAVPQAA